MSLFSVTDVPSQVKNAISKAARTTGTDFNYLLITAQRESNFEKAAQAETSSAAGLFQFIESTWLQTIKEEGERLGLGQYADNIFKTRSGRFYVPDANMREEILDLRYDPDISAVVAGAYTKRNNNFVTGRLGRVPTDGELYIAHFLGASDASKLIHLVKIRPELKADTVFQRAAQANKSIFYDGVRSRSVQEVYDQLVASHQDIVVEPDRKSSDNAKQTVAENSFLPLKPSGVNFAAVQELPGSINGRESVRINPQLFPEAGSIGSWKTIVHPEKQTALGGWTNSTTLAGSRMTLSAGTDGWDKIVVERHGDRTMNKQRADGGEKPVVTAPRPGLQNPFQTASIHFQNYQFGWMRDVFDDG